MSTATFKVFGKLGMAGGESEGTLQIDRETGKVTVRRKRSHSVYETTLNRIADKVCEMTIPTKASGGDDGQPEG